MSSKRPESVGHLNLTTAGKLYTEAKAKQAAAEDSEWDDPTPENSRMVEFWTGQAAEYGAMVSDTIIPLF